MSTVLAPHRAAQVERLSDAARYRIALRLHHASGAVVAGNILAVETEHVVVRDETGRRQRFALSDLVRADRADGRRFWPPPSVRDTTT
jgi:hypothetical protein